MITRCPRQLYICCRCFAGKRSYYHALHPSLSRDRYNLINCVGERVNFFSFIILTSHCRNTDVCMNHYWSISVYILYPHTNSFIHSFCSKYKNCGMTFSSLLHSCLLSFILHNRKEEIDIAAGVKTSHISIPWLCAFASCRAPPNSWPGTWR